MKQDPVLLDKAQWRAVAEQVRPDLTSEEFDRDWAEFVELKRKRAAEDE